MNCIAVGHRQSKGKDIVTIHYDGVLEAYAIANMLGKDAVKSGTGAMWRGIYEAEDLVKDGMLPNVPIAYNSSTNGVNEAVSAECDVDWIFVHSKGAGVDDRFIEEVEELESEAA
ncbi:hypothetical protein ACFSR7_23630 [Cohnella sp. GCM10020058]|uniref:hypothetical protein n=1 Tax=Cohnella sp. GCM10020058 TaxID=3317330 RepID=UPI00363E5EDB